MKLSDEIIDFIKEYTNFSVDIGRMKRYLEMHSCVGNEIFMYCDTGYNENSKKTYYEILDSSRGFTPISRETFIRRIPFFYFVPNYNRGDMGDLEMLLDSLWYNEMLTDLEKIYEQLEYLFYEKNIPLTDIFRYVVWQSDDSEYNLFPKWIEYIHVCDELGWDDYMPRSLIYSLNRGLVELGRKPYIYPVIMNADGTFYERDRIYLFMEGQFPCNDKGCPVMEWIGLKIENAGWVSCNCHKSEIGKMTVVLRADTKIYAHHSEWKHVWFRIYSGPRLMHFDAEVLKKARQRMDLTQKDVAEAIGANVRTYQKWENGETTPDGHYLIRLLNWLDIPDVQQITTVEEENWDG